MARTVEACDLFCGAGGTSTALARVCAERGLGLRLAAVNHWPVAVETHAANHPGATHVCESLDDIDPRKLFPRGRLDVLCASPECTHHSNARGGKPVNDQSRATAWHVVRWAEALRPKVVLVENVREMLSWGPIGTNGRPLKSRRGETFAAWANALRSVGYTVEGRLVNAADYGGATTRTRLFVMAVRGKGPVPWPAPTHERDPRTDRLFAPLPRWRAAREVIDWSLPGESIFTRKWPLKENTLKRIAEGIRRFWGCDPEPFLVRLRGTAANQMPSSARSCGDPLPTLSAGGEHVGLCSPFIVPQFSQNGPRGVDRPLGGITTTTRGMGLVQPFVLPMEGVHRGNAPRSTDDPLPTITAGRGGGHLVQPFLMHTTHQGAERVHPIGEPLPTVTGANRGELAFIVPANYGERPGQAPRTHDINAPLPTVVGSNSHALVEPFLVKYYGTGVPQSVTDPLGTITGTDRFGLVTGSGAVVADILFRMLQPHELAAGMGFPPEYVFKGNRGDRVKQIGNAVEVRKAMAHLRELVWLLAA